MNEEMEGGLGQVFNIIATLINGRVRGSNPVFIIASCVIVGL